MVITRDGIVATSSVSIEGAWQIRRVADSGVDAAIAAERGARRDGADDGWTGRGSLLLPRSRQRKISWFECVRPSAARPFAPTS